MRILKRYALLLPLITLVGCDPAMVPYNKSGQDAPKQHRWIGRWEATLAKTNHDPERKYRIINDEDGTCRVILKSKGKLPQSARGTWEILSENGDTLTVKVVAKNTGKINTLTAVFDGDDKFTLDDPSMKGVQMSAFERDTRGD